jgi:vacuolar protein-sorting-associated protein 4
MKRAEEIKNVLASQQGPPSQSGAGAGSGAKTLDKNDPKHKDAKDEDDKSKMKSSLSSAIISEKPNVKWDDVAGLEMAKQALKEG